MTVEGEATVAVVLEGDTTVAQNSQLGENQHREELGNWEPKQ